MIIGISGSATPSSSTDILINEVLRGAAQNRFKKKFYRLNEMQILLYKKIAESKAVVLGSPIYFDSVSAQTKIFIDRCNCFRPADFSFPEKQSFKEPLFKGKKGGIVLVAGDYGKFDAALRVMRAFFIWTGMEIKFELKYQTKSLNGKIR